MYNIFHKNNKELHACIIKEYTHEYGGGYNRSGIHVNLKNIHNIYTAQHTHIS